MAAPQTSYVEAQPAAYAGAKGDSGPDYVRSYFNDSATATDFGLFVKQGAADNQFDKMSPAALPLGVLLHTHSYEPGVGNCPADGPGNIMRTGRVWMLTETAVAANGQVFVRTAAGTLGKVRNDADGGNAESVAGARFLTSTSGAALALVEVNLPA